MGGLSGILSPTECFVICLGNSECKYFSYAPSTQYCWIKYGQGQIEYNNPKFISGGYNLCTGKKSLLELKIYFGLSRFNNPF